MLLPIISVDSILSLTLLEVQRMILSAPRKHVGSLTLADLASCPQLPNGVYLFFREQSEQPFYIGRASSRAFIGRLPYHFGPHEDWWMNGLSKGMQKQGLATTYEQGVEEALSCKLLLIGFQYPVASEVLLLRKLRIYELELVLQRFMQPVLTARASRYTGDEVLESLLPRETS